MPIQGRIVAEFQNDGVNVILQETAYYIDHGGKAWPAFKGLLSDGLSIPKVAWSTVTAPFNGYARLMAFFHDQAYRMPSVDKDAADAMLLEGILELGSHLTGDDWALYQVEARAIYEAVSLWGRTSFDADQKLYAQGQPGSGWGDYARAQA